MHRHWAATAAPLLNLCEDSNQEEDSSPGPIESTRLANRRHYCHTGPIAPERRSEARSGSVPIHKVAIMLHAPGVRRSSPPRESDQPWQSSLVSLAPLLVLTGLLAVAVAVMTVLAAGSGVLSVDVRFGRWLQAQPLPFGSSIAAVGNTIGSATVGVPVILAVIGALALARRGSDALFLFVLLLARSLNAPLKGLASSPRPPASLLHVTEHAQGLGFPSGHAMGTVLFAGGLAYVAAANLPAGWPRVVPYVLAALVILVTGYGRVETGAHWPSDVLGGYLWGALVLTIAIVVRRLVTLHRRPAPSVAR
jgi:membrane-associated phospholipid phosphatase